MSAAAGVGMAASGGHAGELGKSGRGRTALK